MYILAALDSKPQLERVKHSYSLSYNIQYKDTKMMKYLILLCSLFTATFIKSEDCTEIIALSRTESIVVDDKVHVEKHAKAFCKEYAKKKGKRDNRSLNASFKMLSGGASSSGISYSEIASKYCDATRKGRRSEQAYKKYIESISPYAYNAYEACIYMKNNSGLTFNVRRNDFLPLEFTMSVHFDADSRNDIADLVVTSSNDVKCVWIERGRKKVSIKGDGSRDLKCTRKNSNEPHNIKVTRTDTGSPRDTLSLRWHKYNENNEPVDTLQSLEKKYNDLFSSYNSFKESISKSVVAFHSDTCPDGWEAYKKGYGRFIRGIDPTGSRSIEPDGIRDPGDHQEDSIINHKHKYAHSDDRKGNPDGSKDTSSGSQPHNSYWRGNKKLKHNGISSSAGSKETRPKNVALMLCVQKDQIEQD